MTRPVRGGLLVVAMALGAALWPGAASAHPLGNFTVNLYSGIHVLPGKVRVDYVLDMAEIPTLQEKPSIDADDDGAVTEDERSAWAAREAPRLLRGLTLAVDDRVVDLLVASSAMRLRPGQGGLPTLRLEATYSGATEGSGRVEYRDDNYADRIGWREITAVGGDGEAVSGSSVPARSVSDALLSYPSDLLSNPIHVTAARFSFSPEESGSTGSDPAVSEGTGARPGLVGGSFANLVDRPGLSVAVVALSLLLAVGFGAVHAVGPGHGKTLMAAYITGAGGRTRQAVAIGGAVAIMHTASVLALGFLVLALERTFRPEQVYPWLGLLSGLIALALGASLVVVRVGTWANARRAGDGRIDHAHRGAHQHGRAHAHTHPGPEAPALSRRGLMALAVAGGILPSPTALIVLLSAASFHRVLFGLALIAAFSVGLAAALIVVGILALRARTVMSRRMSTRGAHALPVVSAAAIACVGTLLAVRGLTQL